MRAGHQRAVGGLTITIGVPVGTFTTFSPPL
jgi:hypothetical protein